MLLMPDIVPDIVLKNLRIFAPMRLFLFITVVTDLNKIFS